MAAMESGSAFGLAAITKYGWMKFGALGAAGLGALMMAVFRPPKTRKEMFLQGLVALGSSFLFGDFAYRAAVYYLPFQVDYIAVHGFVGAISWGIFGGLAMYRDKLASKSIDESVKDLL